jgi:hypothetical protein
MSRMNMMILLQGWIVANALLLTWRVLVTTNENVRLSG